MKVSILVPTYKDIVALSLILEALERQTYKNFEVIIAEDDNSLEVKEFLEVYQKNYAYQLEIKHFFHEDKGNRKAIILNKALNFVSGEYLVFIDGDTIPFSTFIEAHVKLAKAKTVLCGRRVNLGAEVSKALREEKRSAYFIEQNYLKSYVYLKQAGTRHYEQGLYFKPNSFLQKRLMHSNKNAHILGSNFSCFKEDLFAINGFDEEIVGGSKDDVDLEWRFIASACELKSCKYCANLFHLDHARNSRQEEEEIAREQMRKNREEGKFVCKNGIKKL